MKLPTPPLSIALLLLGLFALALPGPPLAAERPSSAPRAIAAALHVHSTASDGGADVDAIAAAAAAARIDVVAITDHGDGTRERQRPVYRSGVLVLEGVEISTTGGHYVALGMDRAPYPIGGDPTDVVEDVARLGGFGIAAHPDSAKPELAWSDHDALGDAIEVINLDSGWRRSSALTTAQVIGGYWLRPPQALALLATISNDAARLWESALQTRRIVGIAASDAHGTLLGPSYSSAFRAVTTRLATATPLTGDADADERLVLGALRAGHAYLSVDGVAGPPALEFDAHSGATRATSGEDLVVSGDRAAVSFDVRAAVPPGGWIVLLRNGSEVATTPSPALAYTTDGAAAAYRAEVRLGRGADSVLWLASNAIRVGFPRSDGPSPAESPHESANLTAPGSWRVEHDATSTATVMSSGDDGGSVELHFVLGSGAPRAQFAALARAVSALDEWHTIEIAATATRPMRFTIALRSTTGDRRWQRSMFVDASPRTLRLPLNGFHRVSRDGPPTPPLGEIGALMLVFDSNRTVPGTSGTIAVTRVALGR